MTQKLVVISGPANTGKMPLARKLAADHPHYKIVHRDDLRRMFVNEVPEDQISWAMWSVANRLLLYGHTPLIVAWNMEPDDGRMWKNLAAEHSIVMEWLDIREPEVAAMIPPMETPAPVPHLRPDVDRIAHVLTGHINGVCCHKTGGYQDYPKCECREIARDVLSVLTPLEGRAELIAKAIWDTHELGDWSEADNLARGYHLKAAHGVIAALNPPPQPREGVE